MFSGDRIQGPARNDLADELAAFANGRDGALLLGVADEIREIARPLDVQVADACHFVAKNQKVAARCRAACRAR